MLQGGGTSPFTSLAGQKTLGSSASVRIIRKTPSELATSSLQPVLLPVHVDASAALSAMTEGVVRNRIDKLDPASADSTVRSHVSRATSDELEDLSSIPLSVRT